MKPTDKLDYVKFKKKHNFSRSYLTDAELVDRLLLISSKLKSLILTTSNSLRLTMTKKLTEELRHVTLNTRTVCVWLLSNLIPTRV